MKIRRATLLLSLIASAFISAGAMAQQTQPAKGPVKNIVLVHGAFVGGSGWRPVYDILTKDGYNVTLVQEPLTSFTEDVTATKRILDRHDAREDTGRFSFPRPGQLPSRLRRRPSVEASAI